MRLKQRRLLRGLSVFALALSQGSWALDDARDEQLITAQKRVQPELDAGLAVTILTTPDLRRLRVRQADDLAALEPNVTLNKPFGNANPVIVMRGVGLMDYNVNNSPNIGVYVDEVYLPSNAFADFAVFDVERVEIIKGPQSALWGRNATGGAVLFRTVQPEADQASYLSAGFGSHETLESQGAVSLSWNEHAATRLAFQATSRSGDPFFSRTLGENFGGYSQFAARATTRFVAGEHASLHLRLTGGRYAGDSQQLSHVGILGDQCPIQLEPPGMGWRDEAHCTNATSGYSDPDGDPDQGDWNIIPRTTRTLWAGSLKADFSLEGAVLTSLTSYGQLDYARGEDNDTSGDPLLQILYQTRFESIAQEFRLTSRPGARSQWLIGAQYARDHVDEHRLASLEGLFGDLLSGLMLGYRQRTESTSIFGQWDYVLTSRATLSMGARQTWDEYSFDGGTEPGPGPWSPEFAAAVFPGVPAMVDARQSWSDMSGRLALNYRLSEHAQIYGALSRGYKPGGVFGGFGLATEAFVPFGPEHVYSVEVGGRWRSSQGRLSVDATAFGYDYRDLQAQRLVFAETGAIPQLGNVGDARITGVEFSISCLPATGLSVGAGLGLLHTTLRSEFTSLDSLQRPIDLEGNELPMAPAWSARARLQYDGLSPWGQWLPSIGVDITVRDRYWADLANQHHLMQESPVLLVGAVMGLASDDGHWSVHLWGRNLTDERYVLHGNSSGIGNDLLMPSPSRSIGVEVQRRWE